MPPYDGISYAGTTPLWQQPSRHDVTQVNSARSLQASIIATQHSLVLYLSTSCGHCDMSTLGSDQPQAAVQLDEASQTLNTRGLCWHKGKAPAMMSTTDHCLILTSAHLQHCQLACRRKTQFALSAGADENDHNFLDRCTRICRCRCTQYTMPMMLAV